jgi:hypothetical protein
VTQVHKRNYRVGKWSRASYILQRSDTPKKIPSCKLKFLFTHWFPYSIPD